MSTPNFYNQRNFKLYIQCFEAISLEEYQNEYFADNGYYYPEYQAAQSESWKKHILEKAYQDDMEFWQENFYEDITKGNDGFKEVMDKFNDTLTFHKLKFESGYYSGMQIYVEENDAGSPHELDNDDCNYYFDMCRSKSIRKYDAEIRKINRWLDKVATQYGWKELICLGIFSNGEAIYKYAENVRQAVKATAV